MVVTVSILICVSVLSFILGLCAAAHSGTILGLILLASVFYLTMKASLSFRKENDLKTVNN